MAEYDNDAFQQLAAHYYTLTDESDDASKRQGKFRHIFGEPAKPPKQYTELKNPMTSGESTYAAANNKFVAVLLAGGGGPVLVHAIDNPGRIPAGAPTVSAHKGKTWDLEFYPFSNNLLGTGGEDCNAAVTIFPEEGLTESINGPTQVMKGHTKKVTMVRFNRSVANIMASGSFDKTVRVWDIQTGDCKAHFTACKENLYSMEWSDCGSLISVTSKDKQLRIFDPRQLDAAAVTPGFDGAKSSKCFWIPRYGWVGATGFSKSAKRILQFWDLRSLDKPVYKNTIDSASGVLCPQFDNDNGVLYLMGKGEGSISYSEVVNDDRKVYDISLYRTPEPQKGGCWSPKAALDVWKCEVQRFYKLTKKALIPVSFIVPRKAGADVFQEDIYPDCFNHKPALQLDEYWGGANKHFSTMPMDPEKRDADIGGGGGSSFTKKATYEDLQEENAELKQKVRELEAKIMELDPSYEPAEEKSQD